jgi:hypothetical protein
MKIITKFMCNITSIALIASTLLSGCAGRSAHPIKSWQPNDQSLSCNSLLAAMSESESNINKLIPESEKTGKNVALGIGGLFFFPIWFFMDFSDAEKVEINAQRDRYNHLSRLYMDKGCNKQAAGKMPKLNK